MTKSSEMRALDEAANAAMERYLAGDLAAFSELYDLIAPRLHGYLLRKARSTALVEDLVQQTLLNMHRACGRFISGSPVMPWAICIARRLLIDHTRRRRLEQPMPDAGVFEADASIASEDRPPDSALHCRRIARMIHRELDGMSSTCREAFELVKQDGLTHAEAAARLNTTEGAVRVRVHRTCTALRESLREPVAFSAP